VCGFILIKHYLVKTTQMLMFGKETSNGGLAVNSKREERVATIKGLFALTSIFPLNINLLPTRWAM